MPNTRLSKPRKRYSFRNVIASSPPPACPWALFIAFFARTNVFPSIRRLFIELLPLAPPLLSLFWLLLSFSKAAAAVAFTGCPKGHLSPFRHLPFFRHCNHTRKRERVVVSNQSTRMSTTMTSVASYGEVIERRGRVRAKQWHRNAYTDSSAFRQKKRPQYGWIPLSNPLSPTPLPPSYVPCCKCLFPSATVLLSQVQHSPQQHLNLIYFPRLPKEDQQSLALTSKEMKKSKQRMKAARGETGSCRRQGRSLCAETRGICWACPNIYIYIYCYHWKERREKKKRGISTQRIDTVISDTEKHSKNSERNSIVTNR